MATYPSINFSDVGGNDTFKSHFKERYRSLDFIELWQEMKKSKMTTLLLHGPEGCGKSLLAHSLAGEYQLPLVSVTATELTGGNFEANVQDLFHKATKLAPCILLIENMESTTAKRNDATFIMESKFVLQHINSVHDLLCKNSPVLVICTTKRQDLLKKTFRTHCFGIEHAVRIPNKCARESILRVLCKKPRLADDVSLSEIAGLTRGCVGSDLKSLISLTITYAVHRVMSEHELQRESLMMGCGSTGEGSSRQKGTLSEEDIDRVTLTNVDIQKSLAEVKPSLCREYGLVFSNTTWDDLGGIDNIRRELTLDLMNFQDQVRRPELYRPKGIRVLLHGPSGCGKKSIAMAIANEFELNLLYVRGEEFRKKTIGQSEENIDLFKRATSLTPCLIFIDEVDLLCPNKFSKSHERSIDNAVTHLFLECLLLMQESKMYVLAATTGLEKLDPDLYGIGQVNKFLYVQLPSPEERVEILRAITKSGTSPKLADDVDLDRIGKERRCDGFSGADLNLLVQKAREACFMETFESPEALSACEIPLVNKTHFDEAFDSINYNRHRGQENL